MQQNDNVVGDNAKAAVAAMKDGEVVLLQNTRYRAEETKNGEAFSKESCKPLRCICKRCVLVQLIEHTAQTLV